MTIGWMPDGRTGRLAYGPLALATTMIDSCEQSASLFWSYWGPLGEPAIQLVEAVAGIQRQYLAWLAAALDPLGAVR